MGEYSSADRPHPVEADSVGVIDPMILSEPTRREYLAAVSGTGVVILAGCLEDDDEYTTYLVTFTDQDIEVEARDDRFLWDQADDAGVDIPYQCGVGTCGACTVKYDGDANEIVEHTDDQRYLDEEQVQEGWVLTCVAYPRSDFETVVAHPDD